MKLKKKTINLKKNKLIRLTCHTCNYSHAFSLNLWILLFSLLFGYYNFNANFIKLPKLLNLIKILYLW